MKFGQNLHRYQVVERAPYYIDYQALKQLYKAAKRLAVDQGEDADLTGLPAAIHYLLLFRFNGAADFRASLEQNLSKTRSFYKNKHELIRQRAKALHDHYGITKIADLDFASRLEVVDLGAALAELRGSLKQLLWYWLVNFDKIIGALAKFQENLDVSDADLTIRTKTVEFLRQVNDWLKWIQPEIQGSRRGSAQTTLLQQKYLGEGLFHVHLTNAFAAIRRDDTFGLDSQLRQGRNNSEADG